MADAGLIVLVSLISPYRADRERAQKIVGPERFFEIFVDTPLEVCEQRDPKGLYLKARTGLIPNFTGISAPYEPPGNPNLRVVPGEPQDSTVKACIGLALS
jgi:bifunctional enzyme CysN/CysC